MRSSIWCFANWSLYLHTWMYSYRTWIWIQWYLRRVRTCGLNRSRVKGHLGVIDQVIAKSSGTCSSRMFNVVIQGEFCHFVVIQIELCHYFYLFIYLFMYFLSKKWSWVLFHFSIPYHSYKLTITHGKWGKVMEFDWLISRPGEVMETFKYDERHGKVIAILLRCCGSTQHKIWYSWVIFRCTCNGPFACARLGTKKRKSWIS